MGHELFRGKKKYGTFDEVKPHIARGTALVLCLFRVFGDDSMLTHQIDDESSHVDLNTELKETTMSKKLKNIFHI